MFVDGSDLTPIISTHLVAYVIRCHDYVETYESNNGLIRSIERKERGDRQSRFIFIMADEGTDINHHQNLSICIRYCNQDTDKCILTLHRLLGITNC